MGKVKEIGQVHPRSRGFKPTKSKVVASSRPKGTVRHNMSKGFTPTQTVKVASSKDAIHNRVISGQHGIKGATMRVSTSPHMSTSTTVNRKHPAGAAVALAAVGAGVGLGVKRRRAKQELRRVSAKPHKKIARDTDRNFNDSGKRKY